MDNKLNELKDVQHEILQLNTQLKSMQTQLHDLFLRVEKLGGSKLSEATGAKNEDYEKLSLENFIGLRLIHLVGMVVLIIGISIGVKYAIDREMISVGMRISLAYGAGLLLYIFSWKLKKKYAGFSSILFSGAMASIYFTTYAAHVYYALFPFSIAFILMICITFFTVYGALKYNRQEIAVLGLVGAYGIPFLISANADRTDLFFTYIAIINCAVVYLAYTKKWKLVILLAQCITWFIFMGWAITKNEKQAEWIGIFFGLFFFILFMFYAFSDRFFRSRPLLLKNLYLIIFNHVALYVAALILLSPTFSADEIGWISLVFAGLLASQTLFIKYLFFSEIYARKVLTVFALIFLLIFIANRWNGITLTLIWLFLAVLLFVAGVRWKAVWIRLTSIILMGLTLVKLLTVDSMRFTTIQKIISYLTLGIILLFVSFFYQKFKQTLFGAGDTEEPKETTVQ
jgi:uncharacterized membrane protein